MRLSKKHIIGLLTLLGTVGLSLLFAAIPTDTLVRTVGSDNAYALMYIIAFLGSLTTFASIPYPLFLLSLAAGGLDPLLVGMCSACGVITADTCTFFAARRGRALLSDKLNSAFEALSKMIEKYPKLLTPGLMAYGTFAPLSNDFAVISLSLMQYAYHRVVLPLAVGNMIYNIGIAYLGVYAYDWIVEVV